MPISKINSLEELQSLKESSASSQQETTPFQSILETAVNNVKQTQADYDNEVYKMATGNSDNLHDITIASSKASLSVDLLVQMRNKVLDAYNEIMQMSL
ncbi:MAG TPA: flagellar hook-basal body complex protein FliE [Ruminococcaceae bacterium]|nr:flagellar hook-basal body complex protein FliE [Oscillospiraceae bacterium]